GVQSSTPLHKADFDEHYCVTSYIYTLSLHAALPIWPGLPRPGRHAARRAPAGDRPPVRPAGAGAGAPRPGRPGGTRVRGLPGRRSEEHTSELQSRENLVCRLLLEQKTTKHTLTSLHI